MKNLHNVSILVLISLLAYYLQYLLNIVLSKHLTTDIYGDYGVAMNTLTLLSCVLLFGSNQSAKRFIPMYKAQKDPKKLTNFVFWNLKIIIIALLVFSVFILFTALILHYLRIIHILKHHLLLYALFISPIVAISTLALDYLLSINLVITSNVLSRVLRNLLFILFFSLATYIVEAHFFTSPLIIIIWVTVFFLLSCISIFTIFFTCPEILINIGRIFQEKSPDDKKVWTKTSLNLFMAAVMYNIGSYLPLYMVEIVCPNEQYVGFYTAILSICTILWLLPSCTSNYVVPYISKIFESKKNQNFLQTRINVVNLFNFLLVLSINLIVIVYGKKILGTFGPTYQEAYIPLVISTIGFSIDTIFYLQESSLTYSGYEKLVIIVLSVKFIVMIIPGFWLVYYFGIVGISIATMTSSIVRAIIYQIYCAKNIPVRTCTFF